VLNRGKAQARTAEWVVGVEALVRVLGTRHEPPLIKKFCGERANIRVQAACFGQEDPLVCGDCCTPVQQVT